MDKKEIRIVRTNSHSVDFKKLTTLLDKELWERYGEQQAIYHENNQVERVDTIIVVYYGKEAIACGCFRAFAKEDAAELKRMLVKPENRGQGISKLILAELEKWVVEKGYHSIVLETGIHQHEAIGLYEKQGYHQIGNYGNYEGLDNSACFSKKLQ